MTPVFIKFYVVFTLGERFTVNAFGIDINTAVVWGEELSSLSQKLEKRRAGLKRVPKSRWC